MSDYGKNEAMRWDAEYRSVFAHQDPAQVTDDLAPYTTIGGFPANVQYQWQTPPIPRYKMTPEFIPGRSLWYHEREHHMHAQLINRLGDSVEEQFLRQMFTTRGADPDLVTNNRNLAKEQAASMLPEAFVGEWGGYMHPCLTVPVPVAAMKAFFLNMGNWTPALPDLSIEWVGPAATRNYMVGRNGNPITLIIDHWTTGSLAAALARFKTTGEEVSAHYIVGKGGRIVRVVNDEDTAYHAGNFGVNTTSIGIEHECGPTTLPTDELYAASAALHKYLATQHGIALEVGVTVKRHSTIVPTQCPGTLDLGRIVSEAEGATPVTDQEFVDLYNKNIKPSVDNTVEAIKERLKVDAHHTHDATTSEPK